MGEEWSRQDPSLAPGQRSPSPDLLDGRHHLLDVILGPAPGLGPHGPAGHAGGTGAEAEPAAGPPPVRRAQARRQTRAPLSRPAVPPGVGRALPRSPTPPRVPAPFPAAAPRPGPSPERPGGAGGQSPGLEAGRPRPARARPLGAPRRQAPPTRRQEGGLGTAWRQDSRGWAAEVRSDHVGTGRGRGAQRVTVPASVRGAGGAAPRAVCGLCVQPPSAVIAALSCSSSSHSFSGLVTECPLRARRCKYE